MWFFGSDARKKTLRRLNIHRKAGKKIWYFWRGQVDIGGTKGPPASWAPPGPPPPQRWKKMRLSSFRTLTPPQAPVRSLAQTRAFCKKKVSFPSPKGRPWHGTSVPMFIAQLYNRPGMLFKDLRGSSGGTPQIFKKRGEWGKRGSEAQLLRGNFWVKNMPETTGRGKPASLCRLPTQPNPPPPRLVDPPTQSSCWPNFTTKYFS